MKTAAPGVASLSALALFVPGIASAAEPSPAPEQSVAVTGYYYAMRDEPDFGVGVLAYNRGPLHLEARYNYEARYATSVFAGRTWSGGDAVSWSVTPMLGGLFGAARGVVPGLEAGVAWRQLDAYVEAEYVRDVDVADDSYAYVWSEVAWKPVERLRLGLAAQRTRIVHADRALQRGLFGQLTLGSLTVGVYAFNPDSGQRYWIVSVGAAL